MARKTNAAVKEATAKTTAAKAAAVKETTVKKVLATASEGKSAEPANEAKKAPTRKTAARKAPAATKPVEVKSSVYVQFAGKEFSESSLTEAVKEAYTALGNKAEDIRTIDIYVKPEESVAYYTVNGQGSDEFKIEL